MHVLTTTLPPHCSQNDVAAAVRDYGRLVDAAAEEEEEEEVEESNQGGGGAQRLTGASNRRTGVPLANTGVTLSRRRAATGAGGRR